MNQNGENVILFDFYIIPKLTKAKTLIFKLRVASASTCHQHHSSVNICPKFHEFKQKIKKLRITAILTNFLGVLKPLRIIFAMKGQSNRKKVCQDYGSLKVT